MHDDETPINLSVAHDLICAQFPQFRGAAITELNGCGSANRVFRVGRRHAARFPRRLIEPRLCESMVRSEAVAMEELAACCPAPTPMPVGVGDPGPGFAMHWLVQTWVDGEVATPDGLSRSTEFASDLGQLVRALRSADLRGRAFSGRGRGGRLSSHDAWMEECFSKSEHLLDTPALRRMWSRLRTTPQAADLTMSHKDLIPSNLLVKDGRLSGVLDGGGFGPADPALDLVAGWHMLDRPRRELFRRILESDDAEWVRGGAWAFEQAMGLVWYYQTSNPTLSALGRSTLRRLVDDLQF